MLQCSCFAKNTTKNAKNRAITTSKKWPNGKKKWTASMAVPRLSSANNAMAQSGRSTSRSKAALHVLATSSNRGNNKTTINLSVLKKYSGGTAAGGGGNAPMPFIKATFEHYPLDLYP